MKKLKKLFLLVLFLLTTGIVSAEGVFGQYGDVYYNFIGEKIFFDQFIVQATGGKQLASLKGARKTVNDDGSITLHHKYYTITKSIQNRPTETVIRWKIDVPPKKDVKSAMLTLEILPQNFAAMLIPYPVQNSQKLNKRIRISSSFGDFVFHTDGSKGIWLLEDFRNAAWSKRLRLRFSAAFNPTTGWQSRVAELRIVHPKTK